jgi:hypothetical protein
MISEIIEQIDLEKLTLELDNKLVDALFQPALESGYFDQNDFDWMNSNNRYRIDDFMKALLLLSEFYQEINPVLSASIWGVWNTLQYFFKKRTLFSVFFPRESKDSRLLIAAKALVATAALQFADGTASTVSTSHSLLSKKNFEAYKVIAESAIKKLSKLSDSY